MQVSRIGSRTFCILAVLLLYIGFTQADGERRMVRYGVCTSDDRTVTVKWCYYPEDMRLMAYLSAEGGEAQDVSKNSLEISEDGNIVSMNVHDSIVGVRKSTTTKWRIRTVKTRSNGGVLGKCEILNTEETSRSCPKIVEESTSG